jgi:hypothetical protein
MTTSAAVSPIRWFGDGHLKLLIVIADGYLQITYSSIDLTTVATGCGKACGSVGCHLFDATRLPRRCDGCSSRCRGS